LAPPVSVCFSLVPLIARERRKGDIKREDKQAV
jgi:hypothetical protein